MKSENPVIRFHNYSENWVSKKLSLIVEDVTGNEGRTDLPVLTISAARGWLTQEERFSQVIAGSQLDKYTLLRKGELSYNKGNSKTAEYGIVFRLNNYDLALVPKIYHSFRTTDKSDSFFIEKLFESKKPNQELMKIITSGARSDGLLNINKKNFYGIKLVIPSLDEQIRIGKFLKELDKLIELQKNTINNLKELKKGFLQEMFPKKEEMLPVLRFNTFKENWKRNLLGNLMEIGSAKRVHEKDWRKEGVRFLRARDLVSLSNNKETESKLYISKDLFEEYSKVSGVPKKGHLLVSGVGTIGTPMLIKDDSSLYFKDGNIIWFKNNVLEGYFLYYSFIRKDTQRFINNMAGIGTVGTYTIKSGKATPIYYPEKGEQIQIGEFFKQLDELIKLEEQELEALQEMKKGFLQKMFV